MGNVLSLWTITGQTSKQLQVATQRTIKKNHWYCAFFFISKLYSIYSNNDDGKKDKNLYNPDSDYVMITNRIMSFSFLKCSGANCTKSVYIKNLDTNIEKCNELSMSEIDF